MRCIGQSVGTGGELRNQLQPLVALETPSSALKVQSLGFTRRCEAFCRAARHRSILMKAKSDYVLTHWIRRPSTT